jgi:hypothetical protein
MRHLSLLAVFALVGCGAHSSAPSTTDTNVALGAAWQLDMQSTTERGGVAYTLQAPPNQVWSTLIGIYDALEIPVTVADPRTHTVGNPQLTVTRRLGGEPLSNFISCGITGGVAANNYRVQLSVMTEVLAAQGGGSRVRTVVEATGRDPFSGNAPLQCATTYGLERRIEARLKDALRDSPPADS